MNINYLLILSAASSDSSSSGSGAGATESLKKLFTNPILYVVLGAIVLLIIAFYLLRRFVKARPGAKTIIVRGGKIHKVLDENNPSYYLVPFRDSVGAVIGSDDHTLSSDKLYINNGPDTLYKINYELTYHVTDAEGFYPFISNIQDKLPSSLNDALRAYADEGNALVLVNEYRQNEDKILKVINKAIEQYHIEATAYKVNFIEPMGGK